MIFNYKHGGLQTAIFLLFVSSFFSVPIHGRTNDFYYTFNFDRIFLNKVSGKYLVEFPNGLDTTNPLFPPGRLGKKIIRNVYLGFDTTILANYSNTYFVTPCYTVRGDTVEIYYVRDITLQFKSSASQSSIDSLVHVLNLRFVKSSASYELYRISSGDALQVSRIIYESGLVDFCTPDFFITAVAFNHTAAVNTINKINSISVFPNPAADYLDLEGTTELQSARLFDDAGQMLKEQSLSGVKGRISLSDLPPGFYHVRVCTKNGLAYDKPFIRQ